MFGTSGIRGQIGEDVTAETALSIGRAVATWGGDGGDDSISVVLGRDARESGEVLESAVSAGLRECGADVLTAGCVSTPTVARAVHTQGADAGIMLTASHNPPPDNGIKLWNPDGQAFDTEQREAITTIIKNNEYAFESWDNLGDVTECTDVESTHREALISAGSDLSGLSIAVDVGNGVGGITVDALYELGADVTTLHAREDGRFPGRPSEPTPDTCHRLRSHVAITNADLGIAHDGDADRMLAVDDRGEFVSGDELLALFGRHAVNNSNSDSNNNSNGNQIAAPLNTSLAVDDTLAAAGASVSRTPVGDVFVAERVSADGVVFGGEPSGAWIWPEETRCPDGPLAAIKLASLVHNHGSLATLTTDNDRYALSRESIPIESTENEKTKIMTEVTRRVQETYTDVSTMDGVRVEESDGWFLIRPSGTEALIRLTAQATSPSRTEELLTDARQLVESGLK